MSAVMFDLDGTLCDTSHRTHLIPNWIAYSLACGDDKPIQHMIELVRHLHNGGVHIALMSGRNQEAEAETRHWLKAHEVPFKFLFMRRGHDRRKNEILKAEYALRLQDYENILFAVDDHPGVVREFAKIGIPVLLVPSPDGAFVGSAVEHVDPSVWKRW